MPNSIQTILYVLVALAIVATTTGVRAAEKSDRAGNRYFRGLQQGIALYERVAQQGGWRTLPDGPTLKPGMFDPRVPLLRMRLALTFDSDGTFVGAPDQFDDLLKNAVIRFQRRNGIEPDGNVGRETVSTLNIPVSERLKQIKINMKRWRTMPDYLGDEFVLVNMAGFELEVIRKNTVVLEMKVIVGKNYRQTPIFSDSIQYVEINPYWNVPASIAVADLVPKFAKDPAFPGKNGFDVVRNGNVLDVHGFNWGSYVGKKLPFTLRQRPGSKNALGRMKIMFPNKHNVYLHDTSSPGLFSKTVRTFSSGCIRLERPLELVRLLLAKNTAADFSTLEQALQDGETKRISLKHRVPVHLVYMTAWFDKMGNMQFRPDIYGRDAKLAAQADLK